MPRLCSGHFKSSYSKLFTLRADPRASYSSIFSTGERTDALREEISTMVATLSNCGLGEKIRPKTMSGN